MQISDKHFLSKSDKVIHDLMKLFKSLGINTEELTELKKCRKISEFKEYLAEILNDMDTCGLIGDRDSFAKSLNRVLDKVSLKVVFVKDRWIVFYKGYEAPRGASRTARIVTSIVSSGVVVFFYFAVFFELFVSGAWCSPDVWVYAWIAFAYNTLITMGYVYYTLCWTRNDPETSLKGLVFFSLYTFLLNFILADAFINWSENSDYLGLDIVLYVFFVLLGCVSRKKTR